MLNLLIPWVMALRKRWPGLYDLLVRLGRRYFGDRLGIYPKVLADEIGAVTRVLKSSQWNMCYGKGLPHEHFEASFAQYMGGGYGIAVNTGGMALQMSLRALGLRPGDEVIHQVDTCAATAMAVMNAGCTPLFADVSAQTFMLDPADTEKLIGDRTKMVIGTHMWGNPEDMAVLLEIKRRRKILVMEDTCLGLGAKVDGRMAGSLGDVSVFSFGCLRPIQGGEGGMIFTHDEALARELRSMRHWGDRTLEFGTRDATEVAWNGRMSEIVAALVHEQLKGFPAHLSRMREAVSEFNRFLSKFDGIMLHLGTAKSIEDVSFTQIVLRYDEPIFGMPKAALMSELLSRGVQIRHANFEPIPSLTFIKGGAWRQWLPASDHERVAANYSGRFPQSETLYATSGLGLGNFNFLSKQNLLSLMRHIEALARKR